MTGMSKRAAARIGGILAGAGVVFVGAALIASAPAFADNGPHVTNMGTSAIGSGPDGCAGCHRLHSAAGAGYLFRSATTETQLCENCHGTAGTGASTDVMDGWSYTGTATTSVAPLRAGGFEKAGIVGNSTSRSPLADPSNDRLITKAANNISGTKATSAVTSSHAVEVASTMWGYGTTGTGAANVALECTSCHNPHGNGNFRILRPVAYAGTTDGSTLQSATTNNYFVAPVVVNSATAVPYTDVDGAAKFSYVYVTATAHNLRPGQTVGIVNMLPDGYNGTGTVTSVTSATSFTIGAKSATLVASTAGGYVSQAWPQNIKSLTVSGQDVTFTTWANHGLTAPLDNSGSKQSTQFVTIAGVQGGASGFNFTQVPVTAVPTPSTFTVTVPAGTTVPAASAYTTGLSGGYILGIPDSLNKANLGTQVYQQDNFWHADDHFYTGVKSSNLSPASLVAVTAATRDAAYVAPGGTPLSYTYTTSSAHGLAVGNIVTVTGMAKSGFNVSAVTVTAVPTTTTFTITAYPTSDPTASSTGTNASGQQAGYLSPKTSSAFINNVSQWCSTCHTRYLAGGNSRMLPNTPAAGVDSVFTYRHTSNSAGEDSPNCIQCHVAHGSDAQMSNVLGQPNYSYNLNNPGTLNPLDPNPKTSTTNPGTATAGDSRLLRADNRGVCLLCHNV